MIPRLSLFATLVAVSVVAASVSSAQPAPSLVGTWILTGADKQLPDGTVHADYGPNPHGQVIFTADGPNRTKVELEHRNLERYGAAAPAIREMIGADSGWGLIVQNFVAAANGANA